MTSAQTKITLNVGSKTMTATLIDNEATEALNLMLADGPISITMSDYGGFEKVGTLPQSLPASDTRITAQPGDIMLYQGNQMVIFYGSNTWSYTRLGRIDGATASDLKQFLGNGSITLVISPASPDAISEIDIDPEDIQTVYDIHGRIINLNGRPLSDLPSGIYTVNGKKIKI